MVYSTGEHRQTDLQQLVVIENECRVMSKPGHSVDLRSLHAFGVRTFLLLYGTTTATTTKTLLKKGSRAASNFIALFKC